MTATDSILRGVPLFTGMTDRALEAIGDLVSERSFDTDEDLVHRATQATRSSSCATAPRACSWTTGRSTS